MSELTTESPVVDLPKLEEALDREGAVEMCEMFLEDTTGLIDKISQAFDDGDCERVRELSHMLKGCCKSVLAGRAAQLAAEMEGHARDSKLQAAAEVLPALAQAYSAAEAVLRHYMAAA